MVDCDVLVALLIATLAHTERASSTVPALLRLVPRCVSRAGVARSARGAASARSHRTRPSNWAPAVPDDPEIPPALPRAERLALILERDGGECVWCRRPLAVGDCDLSFEHVIPRLKGGPAWAENEVPACRGCNRARGHAAPALWLQDCERRGLRPNRPVIERSLLRLHGAIRERGGQRRARPYLDGQLRRLGL